MIGFCDGCEYSRFGNFSVGWKLSGGGGGDGDGGEVVNLVNGEEKKFKCEEKIKRKR